MAACRTTDAFGGKCDEAQEGEVSETTFPGEDHSAGNWNEAVFLRGSGTRGSAAPFPHSPRTPTRRTVPQSCLRKEVSEGAPSSVGWPSCEEEPT